MAIDWTLEQLHTFLEVVRAESFTRAAEVVSLSQPAVSMQIRTLEKLLGVQLLERRPRKLLLTDAGRIVYRYAEDICGMQSQCRSELADLVGLEGGLVRVGAGATPSIFTLAGVFAEYYQNWPKVELQVTIGRTADLINGVVLDNLDLAIISTEEPPADFVVTPLYSEKCVVIVSVGHPLADRDSVLGKDLVNQNLVMLPKESGFSLSVRKAFASNGLSIQASMELASLEAIKEVVKSGALISIVPEASARPDESSAGIKVLDIMDIHVRRQTVAIRREDKYIGCAMEAFYSLLSKHWPH